MKKYATGNPEKFLTTQHERDQETGFDYRGARYYDSDIARFLSTDPWQTKYPAWSTYNYVMGNPIVLIDPTGKGPETKYEDENGNFLGETKDGNESTVTIADEHLSMFTSELKAAKESKESDGTVKNQGWIKRFGKSLHYESGENPAPWAVQAISSGIDLTSISVAAGGFINSGATQILDGSSIRFFRKSGTVFHPKLYTSGWTGGSAGRIKTYSTTKMATGLKWGGYGVGVYNWYNINSQSKMGKINDFQWFTEQGSNAFSTLGGLKGAAWGIGWEMGRGIAQMEWYLDSKLWFHNNVMGRNLQRWQVCTACPR